MTTLINLFGASSSGKSTLMADLFSEMKLRGINAEMSTEWVKYWAWEGYSPNQYDQFLIIGSEIKQQSRLFHKVDYIISDSPVLIAPFYKYYYTSSDNLFNTVDEFYKMAREDGIKIVNFFLKRNKPYEAQGRYQTAEQSDKIGDAMLDYLIMHGVHYNMLLCKDRDRAKEVIKYLGI